MKLTPRLQAIANSIKDCKTLADIGTDHAYLPIYLAQKGVLEHAIATDINKGPIENAQGRIRAYRQENRIETRLGSGLKILKPGEADIIVIAGMGGMLITEIFEDSMEVAKSAEMLILQPMLDSEKLRKYLLSKGFEILDEELAQEEHKIYEILWVKYTGNIQPIDEFLEIGPKIIEKKHPLALALIEKKVKELTSVIDKLETMESEGSRKKLQECKALMNYYNEVRQWVQ